MRQSQEDRRWTYPGKVESKPNLVHTDDTITAHSRRFKHNKTVVVSGVGWVYVNYGLICKNNRNLL